jgi:hypothetical protein
MVKPTITSAAEKDLREEVKPTLFDDPHKQVQHIQEDMAEKKGEARNVRLSDNLQSMWRFSSGR